MRLRHIEVFNAIMLTGSVSAAARLLHVSQPAASRTLQHAEQQLGFALFERAAGRLVPTPEARALHPHIERLFAQLDEVQRLAVSLRAGHSPNTLRVLTVLGLSYAIFPRAMQLFRADHPQVVVQHQALHSPQIASALLLHEAEVGYVFSAANHPALEQTLLAQQSMVCLAPKGLLAPAMVAAGVMPLEALASLPVIALDRHDPLGQVLREHGAGQDHALLTVQTYHVALALAEHGLGVALVEGCTAASADRSLVDVLALAPRICTSVHALRPAEQPPSQAARAFTRCMQQALHEVGCGLA